MYNYYPHPSNLRQTSGCVALLIGEGYAGYGLYLAILEVLRDAPNYRYNPDPSVWHYILNGSDKSQVERVLRNYGLFDFDDDGLIYSPWLCSQLQEYSSHKAKLSDAGRRGAAKRWAAASKDDGQAIATPSMDDGQAIAYNITKPNITQPNITQPTQAIAEDWRDICRNQGAQIDPLALKEVAQRQAPGHAQGYIMQVCIQYGMGLNVYNALCRVTEDAEVSNPTYKRFCAIVDRIQRDKYHPEYPANFFFSKILG